MTMCKSHKYIMAMSFTKFKVENKEATRDSLDDAMSSISKASYHKVYLDIMDAIWIRR